MWIVRSMDFLHCLLVDYSQMREEWKDQAFILNMPKTTSQSPFTPKRKYKCFNFRPTLYIHIDKTMSKKLINLTLANNHQKIIQNTWNVCGLVSGNFLC